MIVEEQLKNSGYTFSADSSVDFDIGEPNSYWKWILDSDGRKAFAVHFCMHREEHRTVLVSHEAKARMFIHDKEHFSWQNAMGGDGETHFDVTLNLGSHEYATVEEIESFFAHIYAAMHCVPDQHNLDESK